MSYKVIDKLFVGSFHIIATVGNDRLWYVSTDSR